MLPFFRDHSHTHFPGYNTIILECVMHTLFQKPVLLSQKIMRYIFLQHHHRIHMDIDHSKTTWESKHLHQLYLIPSCWVHCLTGGDTLEVFEELALAHSICVCTEIHVCSTVKMCWQCCCDEAIQGVFANNAQHLSDLRVCHCIVPRLKSAPGSAFKVCS